MSPAKTKLLEGSQVKTIQLSLTPLAYIIWILWGDLERQPELKAAKQIPILLHD